MTTFTRKSVSLSAMFAVASAVVATTAPARADTWRGTAPICAGECLAGEEQIGVSDTGDGGYCVTGHKVLCRNNQVACAAKETKTHCVGVVQICDNGFYESLNQNWHSCGEYACGACLGISTGSLAADATSQILYAVDSASDLVWYRHAGQADGTFQWEGPRKVGTGWGGFQHVFSGGDGVIYGITAVVRASRPTGIGPGMAGHPASGGDLVWYRHVGQADGTMRWEGPRKVGTGWGDFQHLFSGGGGVIYGVTAVVPASRAIGIGPGMAAHPASGGDLVWYRHVGRADGSFRWEGPKTVGTGWGSFSSLFSSGAGIIYAIDGHLDLWWYRHQGVTDGAFRWAFKDGKKVGVGWSSSQVFAGAAPAH